MEEFKNKYYISVNEKNRVIKTFSSVFEKPIETDILIGEGAGSQFRVLSDKLSEELQEFAEVENGLQLINELGIYILKYENGVIRKISDEELEESISGVEFVPTEIELLKEENFKIIEVATKLYELAMKVQEDNIDLRSAIIELYVKLILAGRKTIEDVSVNLREEVNEKLNAAV